MSTLTKEQIQSEIDKNKILIERLEFENKAKRYYGVLTREDIDNLENLKKRNEDLESLKNSTNLPVDNIETNTNVIEQDNVEENVDKEKNAEFEFNPVQLTQLSEPTIKVTEISLEPNGYSRNQRNQFLTGMGNAPFVYYNGYHIEYGDIDFFELYHEGMIPALKLIFKDKNGLFKDDGFPLDDTIITIFIYSNSQRLRSIKMDFKVSNFKDLQNGMLSINGIANIPRLFLRKFKSYSKKTSFETLKELAKDLELGFASNVSNTNDRMTWINTGNPNHQFIKDILKNSYLSDESFLFCYIDFYYNLCYVDLEKELIRDNTQDKQIISDNKTEFKTDPNDDEKIGPLFLTTDETSKESNSYIEKYDVVNRSTKLSLNKSYLVRNNFYNSSNKEILIFDIDSITSRGDSNIILKGAPQDEQFFKENINAVYTGKFIPFEDGLGNMHDNFNYAPIQNNINITELNKIECNLHLPNPNYNLYVTQKIYVLLMKEAPGVNQTGGLKHKRLVGNWLISDISFCFDGDNQYQKLKLIKRDLELSEDEKQITSPDLTKGMVDNTQQDFENELSPLDVEPNNPIPTQNVDNNPTTGTFSQLANNVEGWKLFDIETAITRINQTEFKPNKKFTESLRKVLQFIKSDTRINDIREASYLLGTAFAESGYSLQRWEADFLGKGAGIPYGPEGPPEKALNYYRSSNKKKNYYTLGVDSKGLPYFGRGLIQLTGKANYQKFGDKIKVDLVNDGDKALIELNSYNVAVEFMISANTFKWVKEKNLVKARKSVNGGKNGIEEVNGAYESWLNILSSIT